MSNLTKQWRNGTLPQDFYYVQYNNNVKEGKSWVEIELRTYLFDLAKVRDAEYCKILAPVPSYEQWQAKLEENAQLKEQINKCCLNAINRGTANTVKAVKEFGMPERIEELVKQNAQLKELLKECKIPLEVYNEMFGNKEELLTKIDEALK